LQVDEKTNLATRQLCDYFHMYAADNATEDDLLSCMLDSRAVTGDFTLQEI
jgi:hypothetical protein